MTFVLLTDYRKAKTSQVKRGSKVISSHQKIPFPLLLQRIRAKDV